MLTDEKAAARKAYRREFYKAKRARIAAGEGRKIRMYREWTHEILERIRGLAKTLSKKEAAWELGIPFGTLKKATGEFGISFAKQAMTKEQADEARRARDRKRRGCAARVKKWDEAKVEHIRMLARSMSKPQIAKNIGVNPNVIAGLCHRYGIKTQPVAFMTLEERREKERARDLRKRNDFSARGLRRDGKTWSQGKLIAKKSRFELIVGHSEAVASPADRRVVNIEIAARRAEQELNLSTMDICKLFAAGQIDRHEMSRRLAQPHQGAA